ncbi:MAG: TolC family outer membrane protein [Hydrogenovibrio sp.]|nr:TolC family outer membrane protein [Hydrogenovibrio sp.]
MIRKNAHTILSFSLLLSSLLFLTPAQAITLKEAIEDAISHNPEFRQEVKSYQATDAQVSGAKSGYYPRIDVNGGIGYEEVNRPTLNNEGSGLTRQEASVKLTQNLFEGFGTEDEVRRQKFRRDSAAYMAKSAANTIALDMATAYINLLKEKELLKLAQDNLDTHIKIHDQILKRHNAGISNKVEVDQAEARLALAQSNLQAEKNSYYDAFAKFQRILGRQPDNALIKPRFTYPLPKTLEQANQIALRNHPRLESANADVAAARAQYDSSSKNYYPKIDLEVEKTFDRNLSGIEGKNEYMQAMLRLKYNLYSGGQDSSERKRTASEYQRATEVRNNSRRQVIETLRYAWNANQYIRDQLVYINKHIKLTHETLIGYRKQFNLGRRSLLDLLNTENEYVGALRTLINSESEELIAKYRILSATGQLLDALSIKYDFIQASDDFQDQ